jgi:hypothetical protein
MSHEGLGDRLKPHVPAIEADAKAGNADAQQIISLYQMHVTCPHDPGAPALCAAAFDAWLRKRAEAATSKQMLEAPRNAVFIWPVGHSIGYAEALARHLGRFDLDIVSFWWLFAKRWRGDRRAVVLDHAARRFMSPAHEQAWFHCCEYLKHRGSK